MSEREDARVLANKLLDEPLADPDDDLRTLARQFLRADEQADSFYTLLRQTHSVEAIIGLLTPVDGEVNG